MGAPIFVASKESQLDKKIIWHENFPQQFVELAIKDVSGFLYERV